MENFLPGAINPTEEMMSYSEFLARFKEGTATENGNCTATPGFAVPGEIGGSGSVCSPYA